MIASVVQDDADKKKLRFRVMYRPREEDAMVMMDAAVESLAALYRAVYTMAGKELAISLYHTFIAHQTLSNGQVIEYDQQGFTRAIRDEKGTLPDEDEEQKIEKTIAWWEAKLKELDGELTAVNEPVMAKGKELSFPRKTYEVKKITQALWRQGNEHTVSE